MTRSPPFCEIFNLSHDTETIDLVKKLTDIPAAQWNALAGDHPTVHYDYLNGLEITGCVGPETGWSPHHIVLHRHNRLAGAMPLYLKTHSRGEYVFDHAWAHAFERHGLAYYPKLLSAIPFTPVPGPRLLAHNKTDKLKLLQAAIGLADSNALSSLHILFPDKTDLEVMTDAGLMIRKNIQFHWSNQGYGSMDDFLESMTQKNRKKIRQGRRKLAEEDVQFLWIEGSCIDDWTLDFFYRCYHQTYIEHGNLPYLNPEFFHHLRDTMPDNIMIVLAQQGEKPVASAFNLRNKERLLGRYWGSLKFISGLHFETCYMQGVEYSIAKGLETFEGGAQGEHKLARGLLPVQTHSAHWIRDRSYAHAINDFLTREEDAVNEYVDVLGNHSPFRQG